MIAIVTTITLVFWVFYELYNVISATPPSIVPEELISPISSNLDINTLSGISDRVYFEEEEIENTINLNPTPTPTAELETEVKIATPTATTTPVEEL